MCLQEKVSEGLLKKIAFVIFFMAIGGLLHYWISENAYPKFPKIPKLPKAYAKYKIYNIDRDDDNWGRNEHIQRFYQAWKDKEPYGVYDFGRGLDCLISIVWITDNGIVTRIIIEYPWMFKKLYKIGRVDDFSICYWEDDEVIEASPDKITYPDLFLTPNSATTEIERFIR